MHARSFGWLPLRIDSKGKHFRIATLPSFNAAVQAVRTSDRVDREWLWPPLYDAPPIRPGEVFSLPATHEILVDTGNATDSERLAEFLVAVLGFVYGMLLTPESWVQFYRVSIDPRRWQDFMITDAARSRILERAAETWLSNANERGALFGVVWWHTFAIAYEHAFERFMSQYLVLDACWAIHQQRTGAKRPPHAERVEHLATAYKLEPPSQWSVAGNHDALAAIRNELFHEAKWGGTAIGFGHPQSPNETVHLDLFWFNSRLILALLGEDSDYVHSPVVHQPYLIR